MDNGSKDNRHNNQKKYSRKNCIRACKDFARSGLKGSDWAHTRQNHGGINVGVHPRHIFGIPVSGHAHAKR